MASKKSQTSVKSSGPTTPTSRDIAPPHGAVGTFGGAKAPTIFSGLESVCPELSYAGEYKVHEAKQQKSAFGSDVRRDSFVDREVKMHNGPGPGHVGEAGELNTFRTETRNQRVRREIERAKRKTSGDPDHMPKDVMRAHDNIWERLYKVGARHREARLAETRETRERSRQRKERAFGHSTPRELSTPRSRSSDTSTEYIVNVEDISQRVKQTKRGRFSRIDRFENEKRQVMTSFMNRLFA